MGPVCVFNQSGPGQRREPLLFDDGLGLEFF